ncbi:hypothetical protein QMK19_18860 [Streptomyces sp. H10-C2]|uniref:hypothetical protein n=1 Tax=unclassified Streptomyces TaxID=2593676 RepID=UPI0024B90EDD|nr:MULTISPECIES: hypothetical protein [unclassified Streptomyces]MDJ0340844.1 hypothetical protein [Streptomyces sp. PH10-H1]MDJ0371684.1 hypothetical protein [Streptomyces sp. H10-C2]
MDIREVVTSFRDAAPLPGLDNAWSWAPAPGLDFAGALSADGGRLLQLNARDSYDQDLAVATLAFAREHEERIVARNPFIGASDGFEAPAGHRFDSVTIIAPEVHEFYDYDRPTLTPFVRLAFPAYALEFAGDETLDEAITRFDMLRPNELDRDPVPFLKMRYANTRTLGRSTNVGRGFTDPRNLVTELRELDGAPGSFVEFENRHRHVWRVEWHEAYYIADWNTQTESPRETTLDELLEFAPAQLRD